MISMVRRLGLASAVLGLAGMLGGQARADFDVTLDPSVASQVSANTSTSAPGFASSSWQQSGNTKAELYIGAGSLFTGAVKIKDIASISYWTNKPGGAGDPDWTLLLYTAKTATDNSGTWYKSRLNAEPYFTQTPTGSDPANTWHQWSSNDPSNALRFYDQPRGGAYGTYVDPKLAQLQTGPVIWSVSGVSHDYSSEVISTFSLQTGSAWANGFAGLVDGLTITLNDDSSATALDGSRTVNINLEALAAVPEPSTLAIAGLGALGFLGYGLKRRVKAS